MPTSTVRQPAFTNRVLEAFAILSVFGMVGLAVTALLGFEEANTTLLLFSAVLVFAAPLAILVHLSATRELTRQEKRIWIQQLAGRRAPWVFSDYLTCPDRRAAAKRLAEEPWLAVGRRKPRRVPRRIRPDKPAGP
jgi:hypothetical protein